MIKPKLVIFDMDGTLLDTERLSLEGMIEAARIMGYEMRRELFEKVMGRNMAFARELILSHYGADFDFDKANMLHIKHIDAHFEKHGVPVKAGVEALLDKLEALNIKKCVATSTDRERATHKLTLANIAHRFEVIVGGDEVKQSKPDPEIFLKAAAYCVTNPTDCLVLEDTIAGTEGAFRAGMPVIIIPDIAPLTEETRAKALKICHDMHEVARLIQTSFIP
ncbi:MAG: HAD family phosphatase [Defluviitaleaceae bacterium]|nr:HAD family phosphatase [Defluviitaleaceae bacterium]